MAPENIIEICVAIDIAILGIAYPIIVDKISNIGDKYASQYIPVIFNNEFPQRSVRFTIWKKGFEISLFKLLLGLTIFSFLFLIFPIPPPFGWNFWIINNSAKLIVLLLTSTLTILFFIWLDKVVLYNGNSKSLLKNLIIKYDDLKEDTEIKLYHLKAINELTYYAIDKQDEHLQETLLEFYYRVFSRIRKYHDKTKPLVYPIDLYFFVNKLINESSEINNKKLQAIEHRAVSGLWLLGEDYEAIQISEETYRWLWRNIYSISDKERLVRMYWANANQYFDYRLPNINTDFDYKTGTAINESDIKQRDEERRIFLEFHFALGGLLLYREQYKSLKYMLEYSQSEPPQYVLLPDSMTTIFIWFENFRNEFKNTGMPIDIKYSYPGLDNLGIRRQVNYWICCYLSILFIRQYLLRVC